MLAPIALFCCKRKDLLEITVKYLSKNNLAKDSDLIVFADGAKTENDSKKVEEVREYLKTISGFKSIELNFSDTNKGLANSIINGVRNVIDRYGKIIVLEDDIIVNEFFLEYMNSALEKYKNNIDASCISGYQYSLRNLDKLDDTFFIKGADCWGWATWKRAWDEVEWDGKILLKELVKRKLKRKIDMDGAYPFVKMLKAQISGRNDSWAIRWYISSFLKNRLCLYPKKTLVQNIGLNSGDGTHCIGDANDILTIDIKNHLPALTDNINFNQSGYEAMCKAIENFNVKSNLIKRIFRKLLKLLQKIKFLFPLC